MHPSREERAKAYIKAINVPTNIQDDVIMGLTTLLRNGASVQDKVKVAEPEPLREDLLPPPSRTCGPSIHPVTVHSPRVKPEARSTPEGELLEIELRFEVESRTVRLFEQPLAELNKKIDAILIALRRHDMLVLNILQQK